MNHHEGKRFLSINSKAVTSKLAQQRITTPQLFELIIPRIPVPQLGLPTPKLPPSSPPSRPKSISPLSQNAPKSQALDNLLKHNAASTSSLVSFLE